MVFCLKEPNRSRLTPATKEMSQDKSAVAGLFLSTFLKSSNAVILYGSYNRACRRMPFLLQFHDFLTKAHLATDPN